MCKLKETPTVYIVENNGGEYEDSWNEIIGIYTTDKLAITEAKRIWEERGDWKNRLPIPFDIYQSEVNHAFPVSEAYDIGESEEPCDIVDTDEQYYVFSDHKGYTKEQWEKTYDTIEKYQYDDYVSTEVYQAPVFDNLDTIEHYLGFYKTTLWKSPRTN